MTTIVRQLPENPVTRVMAAPPELAAHTSFDKLRMSGVAYPARFRALLLGRRQVSLRVTILVLLVGLLLSTIGSIAGVAFVSTSAAIGELEANHFVLASNAATREISTLLEPAQSILTASRTQATRGLLPIDQPEQLAELLAEQLRYQKNLAWLSYSDDATGRFVGAWRRSDGAIILNQSAPAVNEGRPFESVLELDGSRSPIQRQVKPGYDPRQRPWYRQAAGQEGVIWTEPYEFNEGKMGITSALALHEPGTAKLRGVFTADFFLDDVSLYLADLLGGGQVRAFVLARSGEAIASSVASAANTPDPLLLAAERALPKSLGTLAVGDPVSFNFDHEGVRYAAVFQVFRVAEGLEWATGVMAPEDAFVGVVHDNARFAGLVGLLVLVVAVALGSILAARVSAPLGAIARDLERVGRLEISREPTATSSVQEIAVVSRAADRMKAGLRSFGHYVPKELVGELLASGTEAKLGGQLRNLTIQFSDLEGYTSIGERLDPSALVEHLAEYLQEMTAIIETERGTIDKFLGDGILAFFNAPADVPDHVALACRAALRQQERLQELRTKWAAEARPIFRARIGLHSGEALVGNIGTPERFEYTVVGDTVNLASRLEGLNKVYGTSILASKEVRDAAGPAFEWRALDQVAVVGRGEGTLVCELLGQRGQVAPERLRARDLYEGALAAYLTGHFATAARGFRAAAEIIPGNQAAELMLERVEGLLGQPAPTEWNGVHLALAK